MAPEHLIQQQRLHATHQVISVLDNRSGRDQCDAHKARDRSKVTDPAKVFRMEGWLRGDLLIPACMATVEGNNEFPGGINVDYVIL